LSIRFRAFLERGGKITAGLFERGLCRIIWHLVDLQPDDENVALLAPGVYKRLTLLAQFPLTYRSTCSGVREAATELAIAATSPQTGSGLELLPSEPSKDLQYLAARRPFARSAAALLWF